MKSRFRLDRQVFVLAHRWAGLLMALFLVTAGLTGSALVFREELDAWLAPELRLADPAAGGLLDPFQLRELAEQALPPASRVDAVQFRVEPGQTVMLRASGPALDHDEVFVNPHDGRIQGHRSSTAISLAPSQLMPFLFKLHHSLALPGQWGTLLLGLVSLLWTVDCFVGAWLTWPRGRPALPRWKQAWLIKWRSGWQRANHDLHRAGGLWLWAVLLLFAWSSVMFNLRDPVYRPTMALAFSFDDSWDAVPARTEPLQRPRLDWQQAHRAAQRVMHEMAGRHGFSISAEERLMLNRHRGVYIYMVHSSLDLRARTGNTAVMIDADTGVWRGQWLPTGGAMGNTVSNWLGALHMAHVGGVAWRVAVSLIGLLVTGLTLTGLVIWWHKARARGRALCPRPVQRRAGDQDQSCNASSATESSAANTSR
ncbi:PepSY-associated TM helix domain-containing protein [Paucibacter sp. XJ19-41]|uniref:PepSY-associated TM helix domain-containing protein n=1 Tax=Paucibacter sp. XJ19-41 TaxID=2927824 RepID=UPI0023494C81|nr:PepSY-associated TM helix domain-containing protein [Paucibacter sp. XJ19-41]MDC6169758.1 PepSY-associated TM helix domain-containing protein [Paucibacter sp. XJ19-41]